MTSVWAGPRSDSRRLERAPYDAAHLGWRVFMIFFGPFCMAHSLVIACEYALCVGDRSALATTSCIRSGKSSLRKCSRFLELFGSVIVAAPADYTRYI